MPETTVEAGLSILARIIARAVLKESQSRTAAASEVSSAATPRPTTQNQTENGELIHAANVA